METAFFFSFDYKKKEAGTTNTTTHVILVVAFAKKMTLLLFTIEKSNTTPQKGNKLQKCILCRYVGKSYVEEEKIFKKIAWFRSHHLHLQ